MAMLTYLAHVMLLVCYSKFSSGCNKNSNNPQQGVIQRLVGKSVTTSPYDSSGFTGGPVNGPSDLNCDFSGKCCWKDAGQSSVSWQTASGTPESAKMKKNFGTTTNPTSPWLVAYSETGTTDKATFVSCSIQCTTGPITVSMKHWVTKGVQIQVCTQPDGSNSPSNCQTLPSTAPGPDTVTLPAVTSLSDLVIVASGLSDKKGSVAMIDDIQVNFTPCPTTTTSTTTTSTTSTTTTTLTTTTAQAAVCTKVQCNFESNSACSYTDASSTGQIPGANQKWQVVSGRFNNPATGVRGPGEGQYYTATYLYPNDAAALVTNVNFDQDRVVRFMAYKATEGVDLQCCCDSVQQCIYKMGSGVQSSDFGQWKTISTQCPAGTKQVIFYAKNSGKNQGAVGLDNIQVLIPSGSPDQATQLACAGSTSG